MNPPFPPPPRQGTSRALLVGLGIAMLVVVLVVAFVIGRHAADPSTDSGPVAPTDGGTSAARPVPALQSLPPATLTPQPMAVPDEAVRPAFWVDVYSPAKVREALAGNAWVREQLQKPLGQGFVGGWAAMFSSRGEDLGGAFKGALIDVMSGQLLSAPFRVVWFSGNPRTGTPAIIVPQPGNTAMASFDSLNGVLRRGVLEAKTCPGGQGDVPAEGFQVQRWLVAEQPLWVAKGRERLVFGRSATVVLQGLCEPRLDLEAPRDVDVELGFAPEVIGREAQLLTHVVGVTQGVRLQFAVQGQRLVARGITGSVVDEPRLDSAPLSDALLKLVPEDTPVLLTLQLKLPDTLEASALQQYWSGQGFPGNVRTRQVALVWTPRGDASLPTEVAVLWGRPEDAAALGQMFSGPNRMETATLCGHHVLASTPAVLARLRKACEGGSPNLLSAAGPVVEGLRAQGSVAFGLHLGRLLGGLLADGYKSLGSAAIPAEIEAAKRDVETLPYIGLRGTVDGNRLVPGGFGS
ncbi:hypothetical protein [Melittangium boletus]|uniref:hypothetical protein n=1 Tax=Melittangium boletus TaxID=83453 RepID=UPI003DA3D511